MSLYMDASYELDSNIENLEYIGRIILHRYEFGDFQGCVTDESNIRLLKERVTGRLHISTPAASLHSLHDLSDAEATSKFLVTET